MKRFIAIFALATCFGCEKKNATPVMVASIGNGLPSAEDAAASEHARMISELPALEAQPKAEYPAEAKAQHLSGEVLIRAVIGKDGTVKGMSVMKASNPVFVPSSLRVVQSYRYEPYLINEQPAAFETTITVFFNMKD